MEDNYRQVPSFLIKTYEILEINNDSIQWTQDGCAFQILNQEKLTNEILPIFFKHRNYHSFLRQLNMYGFKKHKQEQGVNQFSHKWFRKGSKQGLLKIKRRSQEDINKAYENLTKDFANESYLLEHERLKKVLVDMKEDQKRIMNEIHEALIRRSKLKKEQQELYCKINSIRNVSMCRLNKLQIILQRLPSDAQVGVLAKKRDQILKRLDELEHNNYQVSNISIDDHYINGPSPIPLLMYRA